MSKTTFSKKFNFWGPFLIFGGKTATWKTSAWSTVNYLVYTCICKDQSDVLWKKKLKLKHLLFSYVERVCWKDLCYYLSFDYLLMFLTSLLCKLFLILVVIKNGWHVLSFMDCCRVVIFPKHFQQILVSCTVWVILQLQGFCMVPTDIEQVKVNKGNYYKAG